MDGPAYAVAAEVFARFPDYVRGVVVAHGVANGPSPPDLLELLRAAEAALRARPDLGDVAAHPRIASWREAYRALGIKPAEFRSSIEALARRVLGGRELPAINALVDIGTVVSLRHLVPVGGHAIDVVKEDMALRPASGDETFVPMGEGVAEHPAPGELVLVEGKTVLTRRWTWRQGRHTLTLPETTAVEINVDGLPPVTRTEVEGICGEVEDLVARFCGGRLRRELLTRDHPRITLGPGA